MDERVGWTNLSLFSFATCIHYNIHQPIVVKKLCLKEEAEIEGRDAGSSRRRKSPGEERCGQMKTRQAREDTERRRRGENWSDGKNTHRSIIAVSQSWDQNLHCGRSGVCLFTGTVKLQTIILSELNDLVEFTGYFINVRLKLITKAAKEIFSL